MPTSQRNDPTSIQGIINYAHPEANMSVDLTQPGPLGENLVDRVEQRELEITDARQQHSPLYFAAQGVELIQPFWNLAPSFDQPLDPQETGALFLDEQTVKHQLYPQMLDYLQTKIGFSHGLVFDHTIRSKSLKTLSTSNRAPITTVHCDYTPESAAIKAHKEFGELADGYRLMFVNIWIPIFTPVTNYPLIFLAQDSFNNSQLQDLSVHYPDRIGTIRVANYAPTHQWFYFADMTPNEALLFRTFDSKPTQGQAQSIPHTSIALPQHNTTQHSRTSIELRALLLIESDASHPLAADTDSK